MMFVQIKMKNNICRFWKPASFTQQHFIQKKNTKSHRPNWSPYDGTCVRVGSSFFGQCQTQSIPKNCKYLWPFGLYFLARIEAKKVKKTVYFCVVAVLNIGWWSLEITRVSLSHKAEDNLFWNSVRT